MIGAAIVALNVQRTIAANQRRREEEEAASKKVRRAGWEPPVAACDRLLAMLKHMTWHRQGGMVAAAKWIAARKFLAVLS
jgi:hypothetical protein